MTSAPYSYCGPVITDTQSFRTLKYVLIRFPIWHFISWFGKRVGWRVRVRWRGWPSHTKWREGVSPVAWKIWLWRSGIMNEWLLLDSSMTTGRLMRGPVIVRGWLSLVVVHVDMSFLHAWMRFIVMWYYILWLWSHSCVVVQLFLFACQLW
jgi:hypothetical protein